MKRCLPLLLSLLLLCGCAMQQEYSSVEPHANRYWEDTGDDIMRAESYQDLVNTLMLLVERHDERGVLRLYLADMSYDTALGLLSRAAAEVQEETPLGAYVLERLDYSMEELRNSYYQAELRPVYRRTAEQVQALRETASSSVIYDLIVNAWENRDAVVTVRYSYLSEEPATLLANIRQLQLELEGAVPEEAPDSAAPDAEGGVPAEEEEAYPEGFVPWEVVFYPEDAGNSGIVEIFLQPLSGAPQ